MTPILTRGQCREFIEKQLFEPRATGSTDTAVSSAGLIGIALQAFPYTTDQQNNQRKQPVPLRGDSNSLLEALLPVAVQYGGIPNYWSPGNQDTAYKKQIESIAFPNGDRLLFEPGGQVEISTAPCRGIDELLAHLQSPQEMLHTVTRQSNIHFVQAGTNPWFTVNEIGNQLHKPQYHALENYLDTIGPYGKQMMRQTCALNINLDFGHDQTTRIKRIIAANLLVPFATALFANSPVIEGKATGHKSFRSFLWQNLDNTRTGILSVHKISKSLRREDLIEAYFNLALNAPLIYIGELGDRVLPKKYTFDYWMKHPIDGLQPMLTHFANHLTLLFPEVRLKGYLEIRSVDAPPREWQLIPVMFYTGLLYADSHLDKVLEMLLPLASKLKALHADSTMGFASDELYDMCTKLMRLAIYGYSSLPPAFTGDRHANQLIAFFDQYTSRRKCFADEYNSAN